MKAVVTNKKLTYSLVVITITIIISFSLTVSTRQISFWPTDSYYPYIPSAREILTLPFLSSIHLATSDRISQLNMHNKEFLIVAISFAQRILNDFESLYPNILVLIIAHGISLLLLYYIFQKFFNPTIGLIIFFLFAASAWPYTYILMGSHQLFVLMFFLLSLVPLARWPSKLPAAVLSGVLLGITAFSSPTAPAYFPYFGFFLLWNPTKNKDNGRPGKLFYGLIGFGFLMTSLYVMAPSPGIYLKDALSFLNYAQTENHFFLFRELLSEGKGVSPAFRGAGIPWLGIFLFHRIPITALAYVTALIYLISCHRSKKTTVAVILLSFSTPIIAEILHVPQFGRNYFSWFFGILLCIGYALHLLKMTSPLKGPRAKTRIYALSLFCISCITFNAGIFFTDIFPARMATTNIYSWLRKHNIDTVYVHATQPLHKNFTRFINHPNHAKEITFKTVTLLSEAPDGYFLLPPITGKNIWFNCCGKKYWHDPYINHLFSSGAIDTVSAASFKTLASSIMWAQEEEICSWKDLIKKDITPEDRLEGKAFIIDIKKLRQQP